MDNEPNHPLPEETDMLPTPDPAPVEAEPIAADVSLEGEQIDHETNLQESSPPDDLIEQSGPVQPDNKEHHPAGGGNPLLLGLTFALIFIVGLALGFFGRPVILEDIPIEVVVTVVPNESQAVVQQSSQTNIEAITPAENNSETSSGINSGGHDDAATGAPTPTIMDFVLSDARHFQGDEAAPVTIIEFSDFN